MAYGYKWFLKMGELSDMSTAGLVKEANELISCDYSFGQQVDDKGQITERTRSGGINLVYDGLPTQNMINWALDSRKYISGALVLCDALGTPQTKVFFENGALVGMRINYIAEGDSPIMTALHIMPTAMNINGQNIDLGWTIDPTAAKYCVERSREIAKSLFQIALQPGRTSLRLALGATLYDVETFDMSFYQPFDYKGQPQQEVHGGIVAFSIPQPPDQDLTKWMLNSSALKDGEFQFYREITNMPLRVNFTQAYCIGQKMNTAGNGTSTSLVISANNISLNGTTICNGFKL